MCVQSKWDGAFYFMKLHFYYEKYVFNIVHLMCVQNKGEAVFSLLSYFCNMKNVSSKQAGSCFLVYSVKFIWLLLQFRKMCVQIRGAAF